MDSVALSQQLAKQADTGTAAIILLLVVLCVICWPHVVSGISRLRGKKTVTVEGDVHTAEREQYVTRSEFNRHVEANAAEHKAMVDDRELNYEALYNQQRANDKLTHEIKGSLAVIKEDLTLIKQKLLRMNSR